MGLIYIYKIDMRSEIKGIYIYFEQAKEVVQKWCAAEFTYKCQAKIILLKNKKYCFCQGDEKRSGQVRVFNVHIQRKLL